MDWQRVTADIIVMPSVGEETAVLSTIEQMIWSKLVIMSDVGGWSEVLGSTDLRSRPGIPSSSLNSFARH